MKVNRARGNGVSGSNCREAGAAEPADAHEGCHTFNVAETSRIGHPGRGMEKNGGVEVRSLS